MGVASFVSRNAFPRLVLGGIAIFVQGFRKEGGVTAITELGGGFGQLFGFGVGALEQLGRLVSDFDPLSAVEGIDPEVIPVEEGADKSIADAVKEAIEEGGLAKDLPPPPGTDAPAPVAKEIMEDFDPTFQ